MSGGPQSFASKAAVAWPEPVPDWVMALAANADAHGLKGAGDQIGYSYGAVSSVISGKYTGDLLKIAELVNANLLGEQVLCPVIGEIGRDQCHAEQKKPRRATNSTSLRLHAACRNGCPNYRGPR